VDQRRALRRAVDAVHERLVGRTCCNALDDRVGVDVDRLVVVRAGRLACVLLRRGRVVREVVWAHGCAVHPICI
jgi:hypothetical protein